MKETGVNFDESKHLRLPGGEITVWPKKMGFREKIKNRFLYGVEILLADLIYPDWNQFQLVRDQLKFSTFYQTEIPDELWYPRIRTTLEIQMEKDRRNPRRGYGIGI